MRSLIFWDPTQCRLVASHRRFGTTYGSCLHGSSSPRRLLVLLDSRRRDLQVVPKRRPPTNNPHYAKSQKIKDFIRSYSITQTDRYTLFIPSQSFSLYLYVYVYVYTYTDSKLNNKIMLNTKYTTDIQVENCTIRNWYTWHSSIIFHIPLDTGHSKYRNEI